jgi:hypothetical protein
VHAKRPIVSAAFCYSALVTDVRLPDRFGLTLAVLAATTTRNFAEKSLCPT